ncbi:hypothetical protein BDR22DRAFT_824600 [Usnea florida]
MKSSTTLMIVASREFAEFIPLLTYDSDIKKLEKALNLDVKNFHTECVKAVLKTFLSVSRGDAFREAASHGDIESLRFHIPISGSMGSRPLGESNALQVAASDGNTGILEMLLNNGTDVHQAYDGSKSWDCSTSRLFQWNHEECRDFATVGQGFSDFGYRIFGFGGFMHGFSAQAWPLQREAGDSVP